MGRYQFLKSLSTFIFLSNIPEVLQKNGLWASRALFLVRVVGSVTATGQAVSGHARSGLQKRQPVLSLIPLLLQARDGNRIEEVVAIFVMVVKLRWNVRCDTSLKLRVRFCSDYLNFFDAIFCVGVFDYLCDFRLFRFFVQF